MFAPGAVVRPVSPFTGNVKVLAGFELLAVLIDQTDPCDESLGVFFGRMRYSSKAFLWRGIEYFHGTHDIQAIEFTRW